MIQIITDDSQHNIPENMKTGPFTQNIKGPE